MVTYANTWQYMVMYGGWHMVIQGHTWQYTGIHGNIWWYMAIYGWVYIAIHGYTWWYMGIRGNAWAYMGIHGNYGDTWQYMGIHGNKWWCMAIHGYTWYYKRLNYRYQISSIFIASSDTGYQFIYLLYLIWSRNTSALNRAENIFQLWEKMAHKSRFGPQ